MANLNLEKLVIIIEKYINQSYTTRADSVSL